MFDARPEQALLTLGVLGQVAKVEKFSHTVKRIAAWKEKKIRQGAILLTDRKLPLPRARARGRYALVSFSDRPRDFISGSGGL